MYDKPKTAIETSQPYPTLSTEGWLLNLGSKVDLIFSHWLTSQYHQTTYSVGHVRSCQYTVQRYSNSPTQLCTAIQDDLTYLLKPYFEMVDVICTYQERLNEHGDISTPEVDYTISMDIRHGEYKWSQFRYIRTKESLFEELVELNNTGKSKF